MVRLAHLLIVTLTLLGKCRGLDELLSARCQSNCLHLLEHNSEERDINNKRQLKHNIITMCKNDYNCSACAKPCRKPFDGEEKCVETFCKDTPVAVDCFKSCKFLDRIYKFKAGSCPRPLLRGHAEECATSCHRDGDCSDTQKCCRSGCGKRCIQPDDLSKSLIPVPSEVSVSERKRGRSVVVRWVMTQMLPHHLMTHSNLYVIQWKWAISKDEEEMTHWQTITIKNKVYAILKHLLSPGRYYKFRVAAVNRNGSQGFSHESFPFKLSRDPKLPGRPRDLSKGQSVLDMSGHISQEVNWLPPDSDLPIVHYKISWAKAPENSEMHADMPRKDALTSTKDGKIPDLEDEFLTEFEHKTEIVGALKTSVHLDKLEPGVKYLVEVQAIVKNENHEELLGEKAAIYFVPNSPHSKTYHPKSTESHPKVVPETAKETLKNSEYPRSTSPISTGGTTKIKIVEKVKVHKPYFHNGLLKAQITWKLDDRGNISTPLQYSLSWWPTVCMGASYPEFSLTKPLVAISNLPNFELYDLQFGCHYGVLVGVAEEGKIVKETTTESTFETPMCQDTPVKGNLPLNCPDLPPDVPSPPQELHCTSAIHRNEQTFMPNVTAKCTWKVPFTSDKPISGYRVILGERLKTHPDSGEEERAKDPFPSLDRETVISRVLPEDHKFIVLHSLVPDTSYVIQIQAASEVGVGPAIFTSFPTPTMNDLADFENKLEEESIIYQTERNPDLFHNLDKSKSRRKSKESRKTSPRPELQSEISEKNSYSSSSPSLLANYSIFYYTLFILLWRLY